MPRASAVALPSSKSEAIQEQSRASRILCLLIAAVAFLLLLSAGSTASATPVLGLQWGYPQQLESPQEMNNIHRAGAKVFRMQFTFEKSNPNPNYDAIFGNAADNEVRILPYLVGLSSINPSPSEYAEWDQWVTNLVKRYGVGGTFWANRQHIFPATAFEVWNEPNNPGFAPGGVVNAKAYGSILAHTSAVIRANSWIGTKVLFGGLFAPAGNVSSFVQEATSTAGVGAYDGLSLHPYGWGSNNAQKLAAVEGWVNEARSGLEKAGAGSKPLWITEIGWPVWAGAANQQVTDAQQAELLTNSFNYLKTVPNVESIIWYNSRDSGNGKAWPNYSGLREFGGYVRPSWFRFQQQAGVPIWSPTGWYDDNLSGTLTSNPDLASWNSGRLDMVGRGSDGALWHRWYQPESGWSSWENVGGALTSGPSVAAWGQNRLDVVARASNGSVQHWWWQAGAWYSDNLGGAVAANTDPDISSGQSGRLDVYIKGTDNALWHKWFYPTAGWSGWEKIGGNIASGPGAVSWGPGRYDVVARLADNTIQHWWWANGWNSDNLGGSLAASPDMASPEPGRLDVFAAAANSAEGLWRKSFLPGVGWTAWEKIGAQISGGPGAVAWGPSRIDVVGVNPQGGIAHYWWQP